MLIPNYMHLVSALRDGCKSTSRSFVWFELSIAVLASVRNEIDLEKKDKSLLSKFVQGDIYKVKRCTMWGFFGPVKWTTKGGGRVTIFGLWVTVPAMVWSLSRRNRELEAKTSTDDPEPAYR